MASLLSGTTIGGHVAVHANNISTYALTSIPATISPTNIYIGNAIYFGGGNNYFNWDGARIASNVGIQSSVDFRAPYIYATAAAGTVTAGSTSTDGMLFDSSRSALIARGNYPHVELWADIENSNHGGTLRFGGYDNGSSGAYKSWNIGTAGSNLYFLDIGYGANNSNPHAGIAGLGSDYGYPGAFTLMRFHNNGNIGVGNFGTYGIGDNDPDYKFDVRGNGRYTGLLYLDASESLNLYGIRGRFTNEYIHLYEKVGIGHPGGWGQGQANTPSQGLSTYGGINIAYANDNGATINTYTRINKNWGGGDYSAEQLTIRGTYPSIALRSTQHNSKWLIHHASALQFYYGGTSDDNNWANKFEIPTDGNIWMAWANANISTLFDAKQNASTAITTSNIGSQSVNYAASAGSVAWGNVSSKPSNIMYYQSFTLDANTMDPNSTGFTYANNAPFYGPIARFSTGGGYDLWLGGSYNGGGNAFFLRTRNGDAATLNPWREIITSGNIASQSVSYADESGYSASSGSVEWTNVQNKPATFTPSAHNHDDRYYTESESDGRFLIGTTNPGTPGNFTLSIGNNGSYSYVQSHSGQPLYLNPVGNAIYLNSTTTVAGTAQFNSNTTWFSGRATIGLENQSEFARFAFYGLSLWDWDHGEQMVVDGNYVYVNNYLQAGNSLRAPIFYDSNNTNYYVDPASGSNLYGGNGSFVIQGTWPQLRIAQNDGTPDASINYDAGDGYRKWNVGPGAGEAEGDEFGFAIYEGTRGTLYSTPLRINALTGYVQIGDRDNPAYQLDVSGYGYFRDNIGVATTPRSDAYKISMGGSIHLNGNSVDYVGSLYLEGSGTGGHLQPNAGSYGTLQITGSKSGWAGLRFTDSAVTLMMNTNESGHHNDNYGWQFRWENGTLYCHKNSYGGGTAATVLDSSNYSSWAQPASTAINTGNIGSQSVNYASSAGNADTVDSLHASVFVRNDTYNSADAGLQVFRNIGTIDGSWPSSDHTFGLENSDAGNIVVNFHRAGYTSHNLWYNGSQFRFDQVVTSTADMRAPIFYDSNNTNRYLDLSSTAADAMVISGGIHISRDNVTGNGIILADDGDIVDLNDAYCSMRFSYGVRIFSANRGGSPVHTLHSDGNAYFNTSAQTPIFLVNSHSDNTKGYRIYNTSNSSVSAMFTNSANALVIGAGAFDQVQLNKKVLVSGAALGVNVAASATAGRIDASNDIVAYSSSDERLKHNITPIENALDKVKSLTGVEFDWKPEYKHAHGYEGHDTGIIAQQVQEVIPSAVRTNDTGFLAVRYEKLIGLLIEANKELAARVEELEKKLG
jgi:hypothetical protein